MKPNYTALARKYADGFADLDSQDFEGATTADVLKLREDVSGTDVIRLSSDDMVPRAEGKEKLPPRTFRYTMSTQKPVGFFGDVILVKGWDLTDFKRRGQPFLYGHNIEAMRHPLGRLSQVKKGDPADFVRGDPVLAGNTGFTEEGLNPFNDLTHDMVATGNMPAGSVGFRVKESRSPTEEEMDVDKKLQKWSAIFTKTSLIEFSAVPVGMDPDAVKRRSDAYEGIEAELMRAIEAGKYDEDLVARFRHMYLGTDDEPTEGKRTVVAVNGLKREEETEDEKGDATEDTVGTDVGEATGVPIEGVEAVDGVEYEIGPDGVRVAALSDADAEALDELETDMARAMLEDEQGDDDPENENLSEAEGAEGQANSDTDTTHGNSSSPDPTGLDLTDTMRALEALGLPVEEDELRAEIERLTAPPEASIDDLVREHVSMIHVIGEQRALIESLTQRVALLEGVLLPESASDDDGDDGVSRSEGDEGDPDDSDVYALLFDLDEAELEALVTT